MDNPKKKTYLTQHKRFIIKVILCYGLLCLVGIWLFKSPNLSHEYLTKYQQIHHQYKEIVKNPDFAKYKQRPEFFPSDKETIQEFQFALNYENNPEYIAEKKRISYYLIWFKALNTITLILIAVKLFWSPLTNYINNYQQEIYNKYNLLLEQERKVESEKQNVQNLYLSLQKLSSDKEKEKEKIIRERILKIEQQLQQSKEQIHFLFETKKKEEQILCINSLKQQLVEKALKKVEQQIMEMETPERLNQTVEKFAFLISMLS